VIKADGVIVRATQGNGQMPDGTSRFKCKGQDIKHFVSLLYSVWVDTVQEADGVDGMFDFLSIYCRIQTFSGRYY